MREPSDNLRSARRRLEELQFFSLLEDLTWQEACQRWSLRCEISLGGDGTALVPARTGWYVLLADDYPLGQVDFYPEAEGGITATFQHQNYNGPPTTGEPWRSGKICCSTSLRTLARRGYDVEPTEGNERLLWHFHRARAWLEAASQDRLAEPGDPFELPDFPVSDRATRVVCLEDSTSLGEWSRVSARCGNVALGWRGMTPTRFYATSFRDRRGQPLCEPHLGKFLREPMDRTCTGVWVRADELPIVPPWQAPVTWAELCSALSNQGVDSMALLQHLAPQIRDGASHLLLLGFPVPERIGEAPSLMHWQPIELPALHRGRIPGFRETEENHWRLDCRQTFADSVAVPWIKSENWHSDMLSTRGRLAEQVRCAPTAVIGAGAIGSMLAELLVRQGVHSLLLLDSDVLEPGNLARHTLGIADVGKAKATAVASRLNAICPSAMVEGLPAAFPDLDADQMDQLRTCEFIVDCTGDDTVLHRMASFSWGSPKQFASISVGLFARRLFLFLCGGDRFAASEMQQMLQPWLQKDLEEYDGVELPRGGIGCWHPVFPARADDFWLLASAAVKAIEQELETSEIVARLLVFEQVSSDGKFAGVRRVQ
jgi:hypothetical protein